MIEIVKAIAFCLFLCTSVVSCTVLIMHEDDIDHQEKMQRLQQPTK